MRTKAIVSVLIVFATGSAVGVPLQFGDMELQGLAWETGSATPVPGDTLVMVGQVTNLRDPDFWGVDLATTELTFLLSELVVTQVTAHASWTYVGYSQGHIELWLDPSRDNDYGADPPNATAPATFTNGTLFLAGGVQFLSIVYSVGSPFGSMSAAMMFTEGSAMDRAQEWMSWGWPVFSGTVHPAGATEPPGYDHRFTGYLYPVVDAVERSTWGAVKELYRER